MYPWVALTSIHFAGGGPFWQGFKINKYKKQKKENKYISLNKYIKTKENKK